MFLRWDYIDGSLFYGMVEVTRFAPGDYNIALELPDSTTGVIYVGFISVGPDGTGADDGFPWANTGEASYVEVEGVLSPAIPLSCAPA